ncbi:MAG: hypothetical protein OHK93_008819 [Ramalina farinacea]|uniref:Uncharacterized protein n=1 Tax=Ramalina farinacea TaxID=258253 RepID=A0AA43QN63_9LECA|nr:hypothetical protein [Ramalina farinacea]
MLSPASVPATIRQQAPPPLPPSALLAAAVATPAPSITNTAADQPASKQQMPATASRPGPPPTHPNPPVAAATAAPTNTSTAREQPPNATQAEPEAGPSQPRSLKRKEGPGAYPHYSITDHDTATQREQRRENYKANVHRRLGVKKQRQAGQEEEHAGQVEEEEDHEDVASGITEGNKGLEILRGPISVVVQRLVHAMAAWREKAERLQAEKEVLMGQLEEERKKNEELALWRQHTMEPF